MGAIDVAIGSRLRTLRQARALTLDQVAVRVGVRAQQVQKYETGQNRIAAARLLDFARLFGVPLSAFFETVEFDGHAPLGTDMVPDGRGLLLAHEFAKLPEPQKRALLSLVRSLSGAGGEAGGSRGA